MNLLKILAEAALETIAETDIYSSSDDSLEQVDNIDHAVRINHEGNIATDFEGENAPSAGGHWVSID